MPRYLALDLETRLIEPGNLTPKPIVASVYYGSDQWRSGDPAVGLIVPDTMANWLHLLLRDQDLTFVTANGPYDFGVMVHHYPVLWPLVFQAYEEGRIVCVQTLQKLIDIAQGVRERPRPDGTVGYSLETLTRHYTGRDRSEAKSGPDSWRTRFRELEDVPLEDWPPEAVAYAQNDAFDTWDVFHKQRAKYGIMPSEVEQYRAAWALHLMSVQGIRTDGAKVTALKTRLLKDRQKQREYATAAGFLKLVPMSKEERDSGVIPDAWEEYVRKAGRRPMRFGKDTTAIKARVEKAFKEIGKQAPRTDPTERYPYGQIRTDEDTLMRSQDDALKALASSAITDKLLSTYIPALEQGTSCRVNTRFNVLVDNGRTSSHKDKATKSGFNFQNFPRSDPTDPNAAVNFVRPCIVPTDGFYFCSADLDTGELRSLGEVQIRLFGKSRLADVLNEGKDPHLDFAAQLLGITYDEALLRKKAPDVKDARQFAKIANFGLPGGLGVRSLVDYARNNYGMEITEAQALKLKNNWERAYPEMRRYFDHISRLVGSGGARIKSFGSGMIRGDVGYTDCCNHFFSNLVAQGVKDACFYIAWECYVDKGTPLYGSRGVAMIHDEWLGEVPNAAAAERAAELMRIHTQKRMPSVKVTCSPALMAAWEKDAEPVYKDGVLVPWIRK